MDIKLRGFVELNYIHIFRKCVSCLHSDSWSSYSIKNKEKGIKTLTMFKSELLKPTSEHNTPRIQRTN